MIANYHAKKFGGNILTSKSESFYLPCTGVNKLKACPILVTTNLVYNKAKRLCDNLWPYKCEKCLKSFRCKGNLNLHVLIHIENTGNGNQICKICRKKSAL